MIVRPLSSTIGLEISGLNIASGLTDKQTEQISRHIYEKAVICIRDQDITPEQLVAFAQNFGKPIQHNEEDLRLHGLADVMILSNADNRDDRQLNGGAHWHTDLVYTEEPASFTMLHAVAVPPSGGGTLFADQKAAYHSLSAGQKNEIDSLVIQHCYEGRTDGSMPVVEHFLARPHPATGVKVLYGAADTGVGVVGMDKQAGLSFYKEIGEHATRSEFVYRHQYQLNDIVIWDNAQLLHSAEVLQRAQTQSENRIMHRVSVRGWPLFE